MKKQHPTPISESVMAVTSRLQSNDCATWAVKTLTGRSYGEVQQAVAQVDPVRKGADGLMWEDIQLVAKKLGVKLVSHPRVDLENDIGILGVKFRKRGESDHVVVLMQGPVIINTDGTVWRAEDYFAANNAKTDGILVIEHE